MSEDHVTLTVSISEQTLIYQASEQAPKQTYSVSTALNGAGEQQDSGCTPRGLHRIAHKIGDGSPKGAVFIGRQPTGEVLTPQLYRQNPARDWILSRILWLEGMEPGINNGAGCDSKARYIYIHGTPDAEPMGIPKSHGCIRMKNDDVIEIFSKVSEGALVLIS